MTQDSGVHSNPCDEIVALRCRKMRTASAFESFRFRRHHSLHQYVSLMYEASRAADMPSLKIAQGSTECTPLSVF
jgi:hypothetical protein